MQKTHNFRTDSDLTVPFNSQVMFINDIPGSENGLTRIGSMTDGPPIHTHPIQEEWMEVLEGELEVFLDKKWQCLVVGNSIHIPKNVAHTYRNRSGQPCIFSYKITPEGDFTGMMQAFEQLSKQQKLKSTKDLRSLIHLAMAFKRYKKDVRSVVPPDFVMSIFAWIGRIFAFKLG